MVNRKLLGLILAVALTATGCPKGGVIHKVTVAQHNFRITVGAFQDAEISEHDKGFVPNDLHISIQTEIQQISQGGVVLDEALATGADIATIKAKLDAINKIIGLMNADLLHIKNPDSKAALEIALTAVQAVITAAEVLVTN